ncbi:Oligopeptide transport system permease protein AppB [Clostridium bornimense]|uniref:Oligopeptide transport system permease protein AppB n=1 Tax=Clostridium bornimense TaxID=1216932 RepID=W6SHT2_9CLOT|nr:ABC transporter permease [Clostridium bornimense]CDM69270.1 Oligopeptide transport system permease protein AppB [Clostridium bornimense]
MRQFITRRLLQMIPMVIGISIILFTLIAFIPGDFVDAKANPNMSEEKVQQLKEIYGLDKSIPERYITWAKHAVVGDFGDSLRFKKPVSEVINTYVWNSFKLALTSFILSLLIAVPIGIISATRQYSFFDKFFTVFALIGLSIPSFFFALLLIKFFSIDLGILPVSGMTTAGADHTGFKHILDVVKHGILPVAVLTLMQVGSLMRYTRTAMLEVINQDYIRTARAKGLKEKVVIYKHALRNGLIPIVTLLGMSLPDLFAGAIITESVFGWPGIGKIALESVNLRDYTFLMGFNMLIVVLVLIGNLISDISYALVDPRVRLK